MGDGDDGGDDGGGDGGDSVYGDGVEFGDGVDLVMVVLR